MLATFKETISSLQDKTYGAKIVALPPARVVWYWTKYLLIFSLIPLALIIAGFTNFIPRLPRLAKDRLPEGSITFSGGRLSTTFSEPYIYSDPQFAFILNSAGVPEDLDKYPAGVLILADRVVVRTQQGNTHSFNFEKIKDFTLDKDQVTGWLSDHQGLLWLIAVSIALITALITTAVFWVYKLAPFFLWSLALLIVASFARRTLTFWAGFNLVVYASVLPLLLSAVLFLASNDILSLFGFGLFAYFTLSWFFNLPGPSLLPLTKPKKARTASTSNK